MLENDMDDVMFCEDGQTVLFQFVAVGHQLYVAAASSEDSDELFWVFRGPDADLLDIGNEQTLVGKHYCYQKYPAFDVEGGKLIGELVSKVRSPIEPYLNIPWTKYRVKVFEGSGKFEDVRYIQRINTAGGLPPSVWPLKLGDESRVPYNAEFRFFGLSKEWDGIAIRDVDHHEEILRVHAEGFQIYTAKNVMQSGGRVDLVWTNINETATLFDIENRSMSLGTYKAGPMWEIDDSKVVGRLLSIVDSPSPESDIPWLKLSAKVNEGIDVLGRVSFIKRVNTVGGVAPTFPPSRLDENVNVRYTAEYRFYGQTAENSLSESDDTLLDTFTMIMSVRELCGYLKKEGHIIKSKRMRWFEFSIKSGNVFLAYYVDSSLRSLKGMILLNPRTTDVVTTTLDSSLIMIDNSNDPVSLPNCQTYLKLYASNVGERDIWLKAINLFLSPPFQSSSWRHRMLTAFLYSDRNALAAEQKAAYISRNGLTPAEFQWKYFQSVIKKSIGYRLQAKRRGKSIKVDDDSTCDLSCSVSDLARTNGEVMRPNCTEQDFSKVVRVDSTVTTSATGQTELKSISVHRSVDIEEKRFQLNPDIPSFRESIAGDVSVIENSHP